MTREEKKSELDRYRAAIEILGNAAQDFWRITASFLLPHTVLLGFLLNATLTEQQHGLYKPGCFLTALVGILLCILWMATYQRSSAYYIFRTHQAKDAEPEGWDLLHGIGEKFAEGKRVSLKPYRIPWFGRMLSTRYSVPSLIFIFGIMYLRVVILNGPWWS